MFRRVLFTVSKKIRKVIMAESAASEAVISEGFREKRELDEEETSTPAVKKVKVEPQPRQPRRSPSTSNPQGAVNVKLSRGNPPEETLHCCRVTWVVLSCACSDLTYAGHHLPALPMQGRADRKRKVALLIAYCGAGYYGIQLQKNGNFQTIESEIIKALVTAGLIPQDHADTPQKMSLQRAARTDKNVSAVGNVLSLKDGVSEKINCHLPPAIRVIGCVRTTQGFDSKNHCTARTYKYMLPTYSFAPVEKFITKDYRLPEESLQKVNKLLTQYVGTHNFHNFTSGRKPNDPSSKRYIISFESGQPFVKEGMEFIILTVKGQSFMLHHIRKMIGLMIAIVRGFCGEDVLTKSWGPHRMDIPKAPGLGLFLDELFFAGYNKKFGGDGLHEPLVWDRYQESLEQFKEEHVLSHIATSEVKESVMLQWLGTLQYHKFDVIDPTQDIPPDGEKEKDPTWWKTKALLRKLDTQQTQGAVDSSVDLGAAGADNQSPVSSIEQSVSSTDISTGTSAEQTTSSQCQELASVAPAVPRVTMESSDMSGACEEQAPAVPLPGESTVMADCGDEGSVPGETTPVEEEKQKVSTDNEDTACSGKMTSQQS